MQRIDSLGKTLMLEKTESRRRKGDEMFGWYYQLNGLSLSKFQEMVRTGKPGVLQYRIAKSQTQPSDEIELN